MFRVYAQGWFPVDLREFGIGVSAVLRRPRTEAMRLYPLGENQQPT
jgi:hypothetical protein